MHLTKKKRKEKTRKNCQDGRINTQSDPTDLFKTKRRKKKYAAACPTRLCSSLWIVNSKQIIQKGNKLPKLDFLEVWSFFGGYIKVLQCAIFCKLKSLPYTPQQTKKSPERIFKKKVTEWMWWKKTLFFPDFLFCLSSIIFMFMFSHILHWSLFEKKVTLNNYLGRFC